MWRACSEIVEALASSATAAEIGQEVVAAVARVVPCEFAGILRARPGNSWALIGQKEDQEILRQRQWHYAQEMTPKELAQIGKGFSVDTDIFGAARRERMSVYEDFMRPNRQSGFVARYWLMDGQLWGMGMTRSGTIFSSSECARLDALFPHLRAAMRARRWLASASGELSVDGSRWSLTAAEERTMSLIVRGLTNGEAASVLGVSANTVRNALAKVFQKVGVSSRSEPAFVVQSQGEGGELQGTRGEAYRRQLSAVHAIDAGRSTQPAP
ncbi:MAG TPA: helix-turn-helix transcriptional regulator [Polyangiaceae bacterium]|nr:helix-turn-helix transcriptional regulator [Polyangiaceae bacterium]